MFQSNKYSRGINRKKKNLSLFSFTIGTSGTCFYKVKKNKRKIIKFE